MKIEELEKEIREREAKRGEKLKIQLYVTGHDNLILRKMNGVYTLLHHIPYSYNDSTLENVYKYFVETPGRPCNQKVAESREKSGLLFDKTIKGGEIHNLLLYGIPTNAEIYPMEP